HRRKRLRIRPARTGTRSTRRIAPAPARDRRTRAAERVAPRPRPLAHRSGAAADGLRRHRARRRDLRELARAGVGSRGTAGGDELKEGPRTGSVPKTVVGTDPFGVSPAARRGP